MAALIRCEESLPPWAEDAGFLPEGAAPQTRALRPEFARLLILALEIHGDAEIKADAERMEQLRSAIEAAPSAQLALEVALTRLTRWGREFIAANCFTTAAHMYACPLAIHNAIATHDHFSVRQARF